MLYRKRATSDRFYTTSLAVNLIFGGSTGQKRSLMNLTSSFAGVRSGMRSQADPRSAPTVDVGSELLLVVETNFKIYAYTNSTLHVAMLSVFVDIVARLPNLAIGFITRESLRSALIHGISAQQIYDFLMKHVHPKMRQNSPIIPENIADQIYLWEVRKAVFWCFSIGLLRVQANFVVYIMCILTYSASATACSSSRACSSTASTLRTTLSGS